MIIYRNQECIYNFFFIEREEDKNFIYVSIIVKKSK